MIELVIPYRNRSIGSMRVRRVLPFPKRRSVGPFVFVDDFGPVEFLGGKSLDVLPHPHIGLATVTFLFSGKMTHRDSLGTVQLIEPGEVNWMTAGSGIVHSERASDAPLVAGEKLLGVQTWIALPEKDEEIAPGFAHHSADELPQVEAEGVNANIILGVSVKNLPSKLSLTRFTRNAAFIIRQSCKFRLISKTAAFIFYPALYMLMNRDSRREQWLFSK
jgi:redox-sensitive bicupin YhaK (pirin superfamily)